MNVPTIRDLQPQLGGDPKHPFTKPSSRYMGTAKLNLQRASRMPASSRKYLHGDPVHLIDWRAFARNDQLIIREQRDEASTRVMICLDNNDTMNWPPDSLEQKPKKLELATRVALHLAFCHLKKGDLVKLALWAKGEKEPQHILKLNSSSDVLRLFQNLESHKFHFDLGQLQLAPYALRSQKHDQLYIIGDALREHSFSDFFSLAKVTSLIHVLSSLEWEISWLHQEFCYFDEHDVKKEFLGSTLLQGDRYQKRMREWSGELKELCQRQAGTYILVTDQTPIRDYLVQLDM